MRTSRNKIAAAAAAISGVLIAGGATIAAAAPDDESSTKTSSTATDKEGKEGDEATFTGTITAPEEVPDGQEAADGSAEEKAQDEAENAVLADLATVTEAQARTAATGAVPGTVDKIQLEDEDGFVVWEAAMTQTDGATMEVLIDAGDGSVLAQEIEEAHDGNDGQGEDDEGDEADTGDLEAPGTDHQNDLQEATAN